MKISRIMLVSEQSYLTWIIECECLLGPSLSRVKEHLILSTQRLVVHLKGRKWMERTSMTNRRKTSIWSYISCHIWSSKCMGTTRRGWKSKGRKMKQKKMKMIQWTKGLDETLLSLHIHHQVLALLYLIILIILIILMLTIKPLLRNHY